MWRVNFEFHRIVIRKIWNSSTKSVMRRHWITECAAPGVPIRSTWNGACMINQKIEGQTEIGKGPVISYAPAIQNLLRERIIDTAEANKISQALNTLSYLDAQPLLMEYLKLAMGIHHNDVAGGLRTLGKKLTQQEIDDVQARYILAKERLEVLNLIS